MAHGEYTRRQFNDIHGLNVVENWFTYPEGAILADVEHYNGAISSVTVYDPCTDRSRSYTMRPKDKALAIVERHLEREGYKKRVAFHRLDGTVETA